MRNPIKYAVYWIWNELTRDFYVGVTAAPLHKRLHQHFHAANLGKSNRPLHLAMREFAKDRFHISMIRSCRDAEDAKTAEREAIEMFRPAYNASAGGGGVIGGHSESAREKMSVRAHERKDLFRRYSAMGPESNKKPVICLDDGMVFDSTGSAAKHYGVARSALIELCLGQKGRKTVGGRRFAYVRERAA